MKTILTVLAILCLAAPAMAQSDTTGPATKDTTVTPDDDTIRVGNMIIIRSGKDRDNSYFDRKERRFKERNPNVHTNWFIVDVGFNQVNDNTDYGRAISNGYLPAGANESWFDQRNFKSTNINIWVFVQRLNLIKHVVNLKYGAGVELNNYKYTENIRYQETNNPLVIMDDNDFTKNKLAADYVTVPVMLNFNFAPRNRSHGFGFSAGMSAGYLYSARQKIVGGGLGKNKFRDNYDLRDFKISYIGEVTLGPAILYGSYATRSMFENTLDQTPFNFGVRLSNF